MRIVGQVEIDPFCRQILARHWPKVARHDDARTCVQWWLGQPRPTVRVIAAGFPCQSVSRSGALRVDADERWLWPATYAAIRDLRPDFAILENVPNLLKWGFGDVLADLASGGYDAQWECIPASAVGAPHRRDRLFVVAYAAGLGWGQGRPWRSPRAGTSGSRLTSTGLAYTAGEGLEESWLGQDSSRSHDASGGGRWSCEPEFCRVAHGVSHWVDRIRGLGNAVVPQVAEHAGRLVIDGAGQRRDRP